MQVTPENPMSVHELGFDSVWVHSGYFDIIQQHRALGRGHHGGGARLAPSLIAHTLRPSFIRSVRTLGAACGVHANSVQTLFCAARLPAA